MPSEAAEAIWTRWEDRPQGGFSHWSRRVRRTSVADPDDWANAYVIAERVAGRAVSPESALFASARVDPHPLYVQGVQALVERTLRYLEGSFARMEPTQEFRLEQRDSERELKLYREELGKLRSEQSDLNQQARGRKKSASAYLDEAIALAHPIALRLLGWLQVSGKLDLGRVFEVFGASSSTFEGVARLHLIGALKFDQGNLTITSLGRRVLREFGIIDPDVAEDAKRSTEP
jgi:hypothetical protein